MGDRYFGSPSCQTKLWQDIAEIISAVENTLARTQDITLKYAISAFAHSLVQDTQHTMKIIEVRPKIMDELYALTESEICIEELLVRGKLHIYLKPSDMYLVQFDQANKKRGNNKLPNEHNQKKPIKKEYFSPIAKFTMSLHQPVEEIEKWSFEIQKSMI